MSGKICLQMRLIVECNYFDVKQASLAELLQAARVS